MRVCSCGCGRSLEGRPIYQKWHVSIGCQRHRQRVAREKLHAKRGDVYKSREGTPKLHQRIPGEPPREPEIVCKCCYGLPDARHGSRVDDLGRPIGIVIAGRWRCWRCWRCWERYEPEPPIHARGIIGSSGGTCADHGKMYGFDHGERLAIE